MTRNLLELPALIDPHIHFRVPGGEHKEDWITGARAAIAGGVTTVFDMPNNTPACATRERMEEKQKIIDSELAEAVIPLRYRLYLGASQSDISAIDGAQDLYVGIKVFLGQSTGDLLMDNDAAFDDVCYRAASLGSIVAVHCEDEKIMQKNKTQIDPKLISNVRSHSRVRSRDAAVAALNKAINRVKKYGTKMYILHISTKEEVAMAREAKQENLPIAFETTPHHLFLNEDSYNALGTKAQMNPPLRVKEDQDALWKGLRDGTIDTIGTDHAPHTLEEKNKPYGQAPSGVPGIETMLPLLLTAVRDEALTLEDLVRVTRTNAEKFFDLEPNDDVVMVDMDTVRRVEGAKLQTKCKWSPFEGKELIGWPVYTVLRNKIYKM